LEIKMRRYILKNILGILCLAITLPIAFQSQAQTMESKLRRSGNTAKIKVVDLRAVVRNKLLTVQVSLQNESNNGTPMNYRFRWLDNSGMKVADDEVWNPENLFAGQTLDITGIAPTPMATDFLIEINGSK
jgi:uncharacterized protein YcfL